MDVKERIVKEAGKIIPGEWYKKRIHGLFGIFYRNFETHYL